MLQTPLLIVSCDRFEFLWQTAVDLTKKLWPGQSKIYLITEEKAFAYPGVTNLRVGKNDWSTNLYKALELIEEENLILTLEDFLLSDNVNEDKLTQYLSYFSKAQEKIGCLRLSPNPKGTKEVSTTLDLYESQKTEAYRISTQIAIWDKAYLTKLLKLGDSPWAFEMEGTKRSNDFEEKILTIGSYRNSPIKYLNSVIRGKMTVRAKRHIESYGLRLSKDIQIMSFWENYYWLKASKWQRHAIDFMRHNFNMMK